MISLTKSAEEAAARADHERLLDQIFSESPTFMTLLGVPEFRFLRTNASYLRLIRQSGVIGKRVQDVMPELEAQGILALLREVVKTGEPYQGREMPVHFAPVGAEPARTVYLDLILQPLRGHNGEIYAIFAQGYEVTERVLARKTVENERENFRNLFRQTPEMVCILRGPDHIFEFVNEAHVRALGFDATGKSVREAQPESVEVHGILDDVYRTGNTAQLHEIPVTVTDRVRYFNLTYSARRDDTGRINGVMILGVEISEQKRAEEALRTSEEGFKTLAGAIPQMVWTLRRDGTIGYQNSRWEEYTGISMEESQRHAMKKEIHPEDYDKVMGAWAEIRRKGSDFKLEYRLRGRDGTYRWFLGTALPQMDAHGEVIQWFGTTTDIDATKRAQLAQSFLDRASGILSSSLDYEATLQSVANLTVSELADWCAIDIADEHGALKTVSVAHRDPGMVEFARKFRELYPMDQNAPGGTPKVFRTGAPELYPEISDELIASGARDATHLEMMRKLRMRSILIVPLPGKDGNLGTLTMINSSPERRFGNEELGLASELARRASLAIENAKLFTAQRAAIRARDEFLSIASHELKTPLTSLKLQAQMRARDLQRGELRRFTPENLPKLISEDEKQVNRLIRLVEDMLDVSRINTGRVSFSPEEFDVAELARDVVTRVHPQFEAAGTPVHCLAPAAVEARLDKFRFEQVLINLLTNALKYGEGKAVEVSVERAGPVVRIAVRDQGIGIAAEDQERIFGQFERAVVGNSISGLGLGLYISRKIVEAHGGTIRVESAPGRGSRFVVEAPLFSPIFEQSAPV